VAEGCEVHARAPARWRQLHDQGELSEFQRGSPRPHRTSKGESEVFRKNKAPMASTPGTFTVNHEWPKPRIRVITYSAEAYTETEISGVQQLHPILASGGVHWIDVQGLGDQAMLEELADLLSLHRLAMADVVNIPQRPKVEAYDDYLFMIARRALLAHDDHLECEQISLFLGGNYLLTFQENHNDALAPIRDRIVAAKGIIRRERADYLAYAVLDLVIDGYYPVLEAVGEELDMLEDEALDSPSKETLRSANETRNLLLTLRRILWPQRDALNSLLRDEFPLITKTVRIYLRDCLDHCMQISEVVDSYREVISSVINTYLSSISNRMNEIMKVLTIMASIFIPLSFLAGVYGMNFEYIPELHYRYGYFILLILMGAVAGGMLYFFFRRGWIRFGMRKDDSE
jgi:magnesium transporter